MKPGDVHKLAEMKEDHTESRLVQDRDLGSTTPHPTPDNQSQRLELDNKINQMNTESSVSSSSVNGKSTLLMKNWLKSLYNLVMFMANSCDMTIIANSCDVTIIANSCDMTII
jgi:hypothetical protein